MKKVEILHKKRFIIEMHMLLVFFMRKNSVNISLIFFQRLKFQMDSSLYNAGCRSHR